MDSFGGGANEVDLFGANVGNFDGANRGSEALEPDFSMQVTPEQMAAETEGQSSNQELNIGEMAREGEIAKEGRETGRTETDPRFQNALGIATVGVAGMAGEPTVAQMSGVTPHDNRTTEEVAIDAPEVAKDGDKMEKDWMDRARRAIHETKNDPNKRLLNVALLREEYMRKRFNRILGERNAA